MSDLCCVYVFELSVQLVCLAPYDSVIINHSISKIKMYVVVNLIFSYYLSVCYNYEKKTREESTCITKSTCN